MTRRLTFTVVWLMLAAGAAVGPQGARAQDDPFGSDPFGGGVTTPAPTAGAAAATPPAEDEDQFVQAVRSATGNAPQQLLRAVALLVDYGRPDEAKKYLDQLVAMNLDPAALVALHDHFRSGLFFRLAHHPDLQPEGAAFGNAVLDAAFQAARQPARLQPLIRQLSAEDAAERYKAVVDLRDAKDAALVALLETLADGGRASEHAALRGALINLLTPTPELRYRRQAHPLIDVVIAAAETSDTALAAQVIEVLGRLEVRQAVPFLVRPSLAADTDPQLQSAAQEALRRIVGVLPTRREAELYLHRRARSYLAGTLAGDPDDDNMIAVWQWSDADKTATQTRLDAAQAAPVAAARIARQLYLLDPDEPEYRRLYLTTLLQKAKLLGGLDQPLATEADTPFAEAAAAGVGVMQDVLAYALKHEQTAAAVATLEVLGASGDVSLLHSADGRPRAVARLLNHEDRRVRFAAASAIMRLDPDHPYPGCSYLPEAWAYFAASAGSRRVLVAHPRADHAQTLVGLLAELGFQADTAASGQGAQRLARRSPDYEFVLISDAIDDPPVGELMQWLRRDPQTALLPLGLMARQENFDRLTRLADDDPLAEAFPRPHTARGISAQARRLFAGAGRDAVDYDRRTVQATVALDQLAQLAEHPQKYGFYDLARHESAVQQALLSPVLSAKAARVLGHIATPTAQRTLVTMASQNARPLVNRRAAAAAFEAAVQRRGLLLSRSDILLQYDRYNQSATLDLGTQQVLGAILDAIEAPSLEQAPQEEGVQEEE